MRVAAVLMGLAGAAIVTGTATPLHDLPAPLPDAGDVRRLETRLTVRLNEGVEGFRSLPGTPSVPPERARPLDQYVRHYALVSLRSEEDLPFTTIGMPKNGQADDFSGDRIAGVLLLKGGLERPTGTGVVLSSRYALPWISHRGCEVVNVVYDPATDRLVSAWCNVP